MFKLFKEFRIEGLVLAFLLSTWLVGCGGKPDQDTIQLSNGGLGANGVLVDGKQKGKARNDLAFTGAAGTDVQVGAILSSKQSNEIIAFTNGRPPTLLQDVPWTKRSEAVSVAFENEHLIPIFVWIVQGPFATQQNLALAAGATTAQIWADERQGIGFSSFTIVDATANPDAPSFANFQCNMQNDIKAQIGFNATGVNVYYVNTVDFDSGGLTTKGVRCGSTGIIAMGSNASTHLFTHEVGHAFDLDHVNDIVAFFDQTNVMHNASDTRRFLTDGQTFRAVFKPASAINTIYNARPGLTTRSCTASTSTTNVTCPAVQKRIWGDGIFGPN